jgi:hypothetical protein
MNISVPRPDPDEYAPAFAGYVARVADGEEISAALAAQKDEVALRLTGIPEERGDYRYAPGKWSIKEVVGHLSDTERVFAYRALRIGRGDPTPLAGFDDQTYVAATQSDRLSLSNVVEEWVTVRAATLSLFRLLPPEAWKRIGEASGHPVSVRALAYIIAGHVRHHLETLGTRYGE